MTLRFVSGDPSTVRDRRHAEGISVASSEQNALVTALTSADSRSDLAVSRTRRRVYGANLELNQQRQDRRRQSRLVTVFCLLFLVLLTPALWTTIESFLSGAHFADPQAQTYVLSLMLFPGIVAVAIIGFKKHQDREGRREL